jgi:hypothetical protein
MFKTRRNLARLALSALLMVAMPVLAACSSQQSAGVVAEPQPTQASQPAEAAQPTLTAQPTQAAQPGQAAQPAQEAQPAPAQQPEASQGHSSALGTAANFVLTVVTLPFRLLGDLAAPIL